MIDRLMKMLNKANAYKKCFLDDGKPSINGQIVLKDLAKFCRANDSTMVVSPVTRTVDPIASGRLDGRREVWLRLVHHLKLDEADFINFTEDGKDE